jgi:nickel-dependent lactate racemase
MNSKIFAVPRQMWYAEDELTLEFPESWELVPCLMKGHDTPPLTTSQIKTALDQPTGSPRLRELAKGKNKVAILFDDISRSTRTSQFIPHVLEKLKAADIPDSAISFICASGAHGALSYLDFQKKLGQEIMDKFPVYNHNPYENCSYVGQTSRGTKLYVNSEVISCDLKIGIGSVAPHPQSGFSGGGKIVLPGISAMDSIEAYHRLEIQARESGKGNTVGPGNYVENPLVKDFNEAARMAGLDFKLDAIFNGKGQACALFVGEPQAEYFKAVEFAVPHYATRPVPGTDVAVVNTYSKGNEAIIGLIMGIMMLAEKGGDLVLIMDCPTGQVVHYLLSSFGQVARGRLFSPVDFQLPWIKRMIVLSPQFEKSMTDWLAIPETVWAKTWPEVLKILKQDYPRGAKAAVVPDGTIQYLSQS